MLHLKFTIRLIPKEKYVLNSRNLFQRVSGSLIPSPVKRVSSHQSHWIISDWVTWKENVPSLCQAPSRSKEVVIGLLTSFSMSSWSVFPFSVFPALHPRTYAGPDIIEKEYFSRLCSASLLNLAVLRLKFSDCLRLLFDSVQQEDNQRHIIN